MILVSLPEEAAALHIRSQLAATLEYHIERKGWSQTEAARALKVPQPTVSKIVNGNIEKLSIEFLIKLMVRAGLPVSISGGHWDGAGVLLIIQRPPRRTWPPPALWRPQQRFRRGRKAGMAAIREGGGALCQGLSLDLRSRQPTELEDAVGTLNTRSTKVSRPTSAAAAPATTINGIK